MKSHSYVLDSLNGLFSGAAGHFGMRGPEDSNNVAAQHVDGLVAQHTPQAG
jgi:hypothetical protein